MEHDKEIRARELLDAYFGGETTLEQEAELRACFAEAEDVPQDLRYVQAMFGAFGEVARVECPAVDGVEVKERVASVRAGGIRPANRRRLRTASWAAAAVLAAVLAVTLSLHRKETVYCYVNGRPVTDYGTAVVQAEEALALISGSLRKPAESLSQLDRMGRALEKMNYLSALDLSGGVPEDEPGEN